MLTLFFGHFLELDWYGLIWKGDFNLLIRKREFLEEKKNS